MPAQRLPRYAGFLCLLAGTSLSAQTVDPQSTQAVVLEQSRVIAQKVLDQLQLDSSGRVYVVAEGLEPGSYVENGFLAALAERSIPVNQKRYDVALRLTVLECGPRYSPLASGGFARTVVTKLDVRTENQVSGNVRYLGTFAQQAIDTVRQQDAFAIMKSQEERGSIFERLIEPAVIVAGAILLVYLFFTVRSS